MHDRIRMLREDKGLSRAAFGEKLGVSGDVINNLERGRVEAKDHIVKLICAEYSVNEIWLRTGNGSMYIEPDTFSLDDFVKQQGATDLELQIIKTYFDLDPDTRKMLVDHFRKGLTASAPAAVEKEKTVEELEEEYKKIVLNSVSKEASTALSTTNDVAVDKKAVNDN